MRDVDGEEGYIIFLSLLLLTEQRDCPSPHLKILSAYAGGAVN
jgi:hypothetical protein